MELEVQLVAANDWRMIGGGERVGDFFKIYFIILHFYPCVLLYFNEFKVD